MRLQDKELAIVVVLAIKKILTILVRYTDLDLHVVITVPLCLKCITTSIKTSPNLVSFCCCSEILPAIDAITNSVNVGLSPRCSLARQGNPSILKHVLCTTHTYEHHDFAWIG